MSESAIYEHDNAISSHNEAHNLTRPDYNIIPVNNESKNDSDFDDDDSDDEDDDNDNNNFNYNDNSQPIKLDSNKRRKKLSEDESLKRCRERNRKHARNTRERKKMQMDALQRRIQELTEEKYTLTSANEVSVASILISLTGQDSANFDKESNDLLFASSPRKNTSHPRDEMNKTIEKIHSHVAAMLIDNDEFDVNHALLRCDRSTCTTVELEKIRRERNRMHAKKTRLRKKKMLQEMEAIVMALENDVRQLRGGGDGTNQATLKRNNSSSDLIDGLLSLGENAQKPNIVSETESRSSTTRSTGSNDDTSSDSNFIEGPLETSRQIYNKSKPKN
jgi:uncharacterized protein YggL (DUF469 family)